MLKRNWRTKEESAQDNLKGGMLLLVSLVGLYVSEYAFISQCESREAMVNCHQHLHCNFDKP